MPIAFPCPCGSSLEADEDSAGTTVECPTCHRNLFVPRPKRKAQVVDEVEPPPKKNRSDEDDEPRPKKKRRSWNHGDDDESPRTRRLMADAHARLDEEEDRHRREGGRLATARKGWLCTPASAWCCCC